MQEVEVMNYKILDMEKYYRKDVYRHFTVDCKCSVMITSKIDVTGLLAYSKQTGTKFYINFLYVLAKALNSRDDYKMRYLYPENQLVVFDKINPAHYVFHEDTETFTVVYTEFCEEYQEFYSRCCADIEQGKQTRAYGLDGSKLNYFDASYIPWLSYEALHVELPDGHLHFPPIINWGKYQQENGKLLMPVTVRMNHAVADGYVVSKAFLLLAEEIQLLVKKKLQD